MNALLPVSVLAGSVLAIMQVLAAHDPAADAFERTGATLLATLLTLGVIEHLALVVPVRIEALWRLLDRPAPQASENSEKRPAVAIRGQLEEPV